MKNDLQMAAKPGLKREQTKRLRLSNNTRKWAGRFLANSRAAELERNCQEIQRQFPEAPRVNWNDLPAAQGILFRFFLHEQILQRDSSSLLHYAWCYYRVLPIAGQVTRNLDEMVAEGVEGAEQRQRKWQKRLRKIEKQFGKCGVRHLAYMLWPSLDPTIREQHHVQANEELARFIKKRWIFGRRTQPSCSSPPSTTLMLVPVLRTVMP